MKFFLCFIIIIISMCFQSLSVLQLFAAGPGFYSWQLSACSTCILMCVINFCKIVRNSHLLTLHTRKVCFLIVSLVFFLQFTQLVALWVCKILLTYAKAQT